MMVAILYKGDGLDAFRETAQEEHDATKPHSRREWGWKATPEASLQDSLLLRFVLPKRLYFARNGVNYSWRLLSGQGRES